MNKEIIFITSNKGKLATAQRHFDKSITLLPYDYDIIEPNVNDIEYIAEYKVREGYKKVGKPCITLDAGFYIDNFPNNPNFPGAFPRRELMEKLGINGLLEKMKYVEDRSCCFRECLAFFDGKTLKKFYGKYPGKLSTEIRGVDSANKWSDLWYVFIPEGYDKTMAEMTDDERSKRDDGYINPFIDFCDWYLDYKENEENN